MQPGDEDGVSYTLQVDNAPGPNPMVNASLQISVLPNPGNLVLIDSTYTTQDIATSSPVRIRVAILLYLSCELNFYGLLLVCVGREP